MSEVQLGPRIGSGTFGVVGNVVCFYLIRKVYQATWRGATIAIKKLPAQQFSKAALIEFQKEINLMKY